MSSIDYRVYIRNDRVQKICVKISGQQEKIKLK